MVNAKATTEERRTRERPSASHEGGLGAAKLNPFGDLNTVQHLAARFARSLRGLFEPLLNAEVRAWAEPLMVERFADYRNARPDTLTAWLPLAMKPQPSVALAVLDGRFALELLDRFFGGSGAAPVPMPGDFSPAAEAMLLRLAGTMTADLATAWEPLATIDFAASRVETNAAALPVDGETAMVVTRFGIASGDAAPVFIDLLYPVPSLKPYGATLMGKVLDKAEADPVWRTSLTRSIMNVTLPVRSVLAEPVVPLQMLIDLKPGDVIPITIAPEVPVVVGDHRLGCGIVGTSNGLAAIRLTSLARPEEGFSL